MSNLSFSFELAQQLYKSAEKFPVSFDDAWVWMGYSRKDNAKRNFEKAGFVQGIDFEVFLIPAENSSGGRPVEQIKLSVECFKQWGMMAGTEKGRQIRLYFIECERIAKSNPAPQPQTSAEMFLMIAQQLVEQERKTKELEAKLLQIESAREEAIAALDETPEPSVEAEELTTRAKVRRLVNDYCAAKLVHQQEVWRRLYREFKDRYHIDLRQRAKNIQAAGGKKFGPMDICEQLGKIEELYAVAFDLLKAA